MQCHFQDNVSLHGDGDQTLTLISKVLKISESETHIGTCEIDI